MYDRTNPAFFVFFYVPSITSSLQKDASDELMIEERIDKKHRRLFRVALSLESHEEWGGII